MTCEIFFHAAGYSMGPDVTKHTPYLIEVSETERQLIYPEGAMFTFVKLGDEWVLPNCEPVLYLDPPHNTKLASTFEGDYFIYLMNYHSAYTNKMEEGFQRPTPLNHFTDKLAELSVQGQNILRVLVPEGGLPAIRETFNPWDEAVALSMGSFYIKIGEEVIQISGFEEFFYVHTADGTINKRYCLNEFIKYVTQWESELPVPEDIVIQ